jgi:CPA1 family monovalent cation:H+ antiporter
MVVSATSADHQAALGLVIAEYEQRLSVLTAEGETRLSAQRRRGAGHRYRMKALLAERHALDNLWRSGAIIDEVHRPLQLLLDHEEGMLRASEPEAEAGATG